MNVKICYRVERLFNNYRSTIRPGGIALSSANDDSLHLVGDEFEIISELSEKADEAAAKIEKLIQERSASLELAAALEDLGNHFLEMSEEVSASYSRRSRLRAVE